MEDAASLVLRLVVGGIFLAGGYRKLLADPDAFQGRAGLAKMIGGKGFPRESELAFLVGLAQFAGGTLVLLGLVMRAALIPLILIVAVATVAFKWEVGFFGGWDWPLSVVGASVALFLLGPGSYSVDALLDVPLMT